MTVAYRYITYIYNYIYRENVALKSQVWGLLTLAQLQRFVSARQQKMEKKAETRPSVDLTNETQHGGTREVSLECAKRKSAVDRLFTIIS